MFLAVARFELARQLRGHVFWVVFAISLGMVLGSVGVDALRVGVHPGGLRNGAEAIILTHLVWSLFFMFATAAFVANAVLRDTAVGFAPVFAATPVGRRNYLYGRFSGAFAAVLLCFLSVPVGMMAGAAMPWVSPRSVGPIHPEALAFAYLVMGVPNLLLSAAVGFALATITRSMNASLVGAVALLIAYGLGARQGATLPPVVEPFGFAAYARSVAAWTAAERDRLTPALHGLLLLNRLLVVAGSGLLLALASARIDRPARRPAAAPTGPAPPEPARAIRMFIPQFDRWTLLRQFDGRTRLEVRQVVQTPIYAALMILGLVNTLATIRPLPQPTAAAVVTALGGAFQLTTIVIALFFSGELRWNERERQVDTLLAAFPIRPAAFLLPKFVAIAVVLVTSLALAGGVTALLLALDGNASAAVRVPDWLLSASYDALTFAALALFLQVLAPNKLAGWGYTILFLIASLALDRLGLVDPLYRYGRYPGYPLPGSITGDAVAPFRWLWAGVAALLLAIAGRRRITPA